MLLRKMLRDMKQNLTQFVSIFLMSVLGVLVFSGIHAEWYGMKAEADRYYQQSDFPDFWIIGKDFGKKDTDDVSNIKGVSAVSRRLTLDGIADLGNRPTIRLNIAEDNYLSRPFLVEGEDFDTGKDGLWLDRSFAEAHGLKAGETITINALGVSFSKTILGTILHPEYIYNIKDESELLPNPDEFGFAFLGRSALPGGLPLPFNQLLIKASEGASLDLVQTELEKSLLGRFSFIAARDSHPSYAMFQSEIEQNKAMGGVFPVIFFVIAALTMLTTMTRLTNNQRTQIGTLKAIGFSKSTILFHYVSYGLWIGILGGVAGLFLGPVIIPPILFSMQKSIYLLPAWYAVISPSDWLAVIAAVLCCGASSYFACRKELKDVPAASLRPRAPKAGRHTRWERSGIWNKLGFSAQWNIRDIMRSRIRSIMAVAGVTGCMALLLCALGLRDTIDGVSTWMYRDLHTYNNKINLTEQISPDETNTLKSRFKGQLMQETGIELMTGDDKKTGTLTVLDEGSMIRFEDTSRNAVRLPDHGIALSRKMAVLLDADIGETVKWRIIGQDHWYETRVGVIYRTPMGQGIAMTQNAYRKMGAGMQPTALLTSHDVKESEKIPGVKSIQDKSSLMQSFNTMLDSMQMMIGILILAAVILGVVVLYNLGALSFTERLREMATLKVLGFFPGQIRSLLNKQNIWLTSIGILAGIPFGYGIIEFILSTMTDTSDMLTRVTFLSLTICIVGTFFLSVGVNFLLSSKVKKIDMVSSLKAVE